MKKKKLLIISIIPLLITVGCNQGASASSSISSSDQSITSSEATSSNHETSTSTTSSTTSRSSSSPSSSSSSSSSWPSDKLYIDKQVNANHKSHVKCPDSTTLRYYKDTPNVPYISVDKYYKEFFRTELDIVRENNNTLRYSLPSGSYFAFDYTNDVFTSNDLVAFSDHPDFVSSTSKIFIQDKLNTTKSQPEIGTINLAKYSINVYFDDEDVYAPLTLLSSFSGSVAVYNIAYNGEEIFILDWYEMMGEQTTPDSYSNYYTKIDDLTEARPVDLANYVYNELCMSFDSYRGYTKQMVFGDELFQTLGLDGLLEQHHPKIKQYLLSADKEKYYQGLEALFAGLYDGGHTYLPNGSNAYERAKSKASSVSEFNILLNKAENIYNKQAITYYSFYFDRPIGGRSYYYYHPEGSETAYIGFPQFRVDYEGWDDYYKGLGPAPTNGDSFGFVLSRFKRAKQEGVKNIVIDICSNGGGDSYANIGLLSLLNGGVGFDCSKDTFNKYDMVDEYIVDINLDGKYDEQDKEAAKSFDFNIGILTSYYSFSCANFFPACAKELGIKILGQKSGGGSCSICSQTTADGIPFIRSNFLMCSNRAGDNIDGGVPVDYPIEYGDQYARYYDVSPFYDIDAIGLYLSNAYK